MIQFEEHPYTEIIYIVNLNCEITIWKEFDIISFHIFYVRESDETKSQIPIKSDGTIGEKNMIVGPPVYWETDDMTIILILYV